VTVVSPGRAHTILALAVALRAVGIGIGLLVGSGACGGTARVGSTQLRGR
jgi:hypothetical protein